MIDDAALVDSCFFFLRSERICVVGHGCRFVQGFSFSSISQSIVLLRNEANTLPFPKGVKLAVIGPHYEANIALVGDYYGQLCIEGPLDFNCITTVQ